MSSYLTFSPLPRWLIRAVIFCGTCCSPTRLETRPLAGVLPCTVRTFLPPNKPESDSLADRYANVIRFEAFSRLFNFKCNTNENRVVPHFENITTKLSFPCDLFIPCLRQAGLRGTIGTLRGRGRRVASQSDSCWIQTDTLLRIVLIDSQ